MYYGINYDDGYVVTLTQVWEDGRLKAKPLRKFKEQGDAKVFQLHDCPHLTELQLRGLVKNYDPAKKFIRYSEKQFRWSS